MAYSVPTADFVASTLNGAIVAGATTATIGTGLTIPATNGLLQIDYDSSTAVGADNGPETIAYATYNSGTGALTGLARGVAGTTGVAHGNGAKVSAGYSSAHLTQDAATTWTANASTFSYATADSPTFPMTVASDITTSVYPGVRVKLDQEQALSHYWTFNASSTADVGAATMGDVSDPAYSAGKFGNALTLDGNDALTITDAASFHLGLSGADFTVGAWIKTSTTGAVQTIFQSYSDNTNANGIWLYIYTTNKIGLYVGNNAADPSTSMVGTTTVTDNAWHYVVWTFRNNYSQVYLDGKLEMSGYAVTPTFAATTYTRIGCGNVSGTDNNFFTGQIDDLFLINGYALDEQYIAAKYALGTAQGIANIALTKYFLCTASSYSAPNTTVTMYGGTDYALANSTITNVYYSTQKAPYGFPLNPDKWKVEFSSAVKSYKTSPSDGTYYGGANAWTAGDAVLVSVPIGAWNLSYVAILDLYKAAAAALNGVTALSTSNSSASEPRLKSFHVVNSTAAVVEHTRTAPVKVSTKTTYYLIAYGVGTLAEMSFRGDVIPTTITATSTLL